MPGNSAAWEPGKALSSLHHLQETEQVLSAIVLLLGPDTDYQKRMRASQLLARAGPAILPLLLRSLHLHPEITTPEWPWWPPQYERISRLLIQVSQDAHLSLVELLHAPDPTQPPGPVLWTSVLEAVGLLPHGEYQALLSEGLEAPWWSVRYAAATAIARRAAQSSLSPEMRQALQQCQRLDPQVAVRLVAACALLRCGDSSGLDTLLHLLEIPSAHELRKTTIFILATELPVPLKPEQKERLADVLLRSLQDTDPQIALHAARALCNVANSRNLSELDRLLDHPCPSVRLATLTTLEELASRKTMRYAIQQRLIPQHIASLMYTTEPETRRQACYTLATLGGEYATAVLGVIVLDTLHPARLEAIEALRLLPGIQRPVDQARVIRWLLHALAQPIELVEICALDSLSYIIWQARAHRRRTVLDTISEDLTSSGTIFQLLASASAWVRQRTVELLSQLDTQLLKQRATLLEMLHHDIDSGVRACIASTLGQNATLWAIPDLLQATLDSDEYVGESALNALCSLPLRDDALLIYTLQELAAYHLPLASLYESQHLAQAARAWLKKRAKADQPVPRV